MTQTNVMNRRQLKPGTEPSPFDANPSDFPGWSSAKVSDFLLGRKANDHFPIPMTWLKTCGGRLLAVRDALRSAWVGLKVGGIGALTDWLLAAAIARENPLLLGPPGVAKGEISVLLFRLLGLGTPPESGSPEPGRTWRERADLEKEQQKYFHYLLNRFTQPEELFGPIEISLLREGILARVNHGLLTGPGVRAAFLDEVFKASPNILNSLLTLLMERKFFNWGGMRDSDLIIAIGASNEMPGEGFGGAQFGASIEEFGNLYPFLDRFAIRLSVPLVEGTINSDGPHDGQFTIAAAESDLGRAFDVAIGREARRFSRGDYFDEGEPIEKSCINDLLLAGRACYQHEKARSIGAPKATKEPAGGSGCNELFQNLPDFRRAFLEIASQLREQNTRVSFGELTWTISPRKLRSLYKIALAHALISADNFLGDARQNVDTISCLGKRQLGVFNLIWDSSVARTELEQQVRQLVEQHAQGLPEGA